MENKGKTNFSYSNKLTSIFEIELYFHKELNPHAPKLNNTLYDNDITSSRDFNLLPDIHVKFVLDSIQPDRTPTVFDNYTRP